MRDGEPLLRFVDAAVGRDAAELARARQALRERVGDAATVDAAAVVANFERMVRIADGTGIPLDEPVAFFSADLRERLGIAGYGSAQNTPRASALVRLASRALQPLLRRALRRFGGR